MNVSTQQIEVKLIRCCLAYARLEIFDQTTLSAYGTGAENDISLNIGHLQSSLEDAVAQIVESALLNEGEIMHFSCYRIQAREDAGHGWANVLIDYETFEDAQKAFDKFSVKGEKRIVRVCEDVCCHSEQPISQLAPGGAEKSSND